MKRLLVSGVIGAVLLFTAHPGYSAAPLTVAGAETINLSQTKDLYRHGAAIIDIRSDYQYGNRHIPGAINLPLKEDFNETNLLRYVQKQTPFVIYGNGEHRSDAASAVEKAVSWGFRQVKYFRDGMAGWHEDGSPVKILNY